MSANTTPRIFISAGEPSGDLHGANLARALRRAAPDVVCEGFGGDRMAEAGCGLLHPLAAHPLMGVAQVVRHLPEMVRLVNRATDHLRQHRPDAVVLIDYPGFNWWMARRARALGIPVYYFVPPQIWAWASWRVRKMRKYVDRVCCNLPFETEWYRSRGVNAEYVGHPYFDAVAAQQPDPEFLGRQAARAGTLVGLLPGSRRSEVENNFVSQARAAAAIHARRPDARFLVACFKPEHADRCARVLRDVCPGPVRAESGNLRDGLRGPWAVPVELCVGRTAEIIAASHTCVSVSGSVSLELLHAARPSVMLYRGPLALHAVYRLLRNVRYFTLVNLLAGRELLPEFGSTFCKAPGIAAKVLRWLDDPAAHAAVRQDLIDLRDRVARPGACARAAELILSALAHTRAA